MHEVSLVRSLIRQVETLLADEGGGAVTEIHVSIGPLSGVEPLLVRSAFDQLAATSQVAGAKLTIDCKQLEAICRACGTSFVVESFRFRCTACQSSSVRVTGGDEFRLLSVSIENEHEACCLNKVTTT